MSFRCIVFVCTTPFLAAAGCEDLPTGPGGGDEGAAFVTVTTADEELVLEHDPLQSDLSLTPPAEGVVELTFAFQDPAVELRLRVDGNAASEGDTVDLPSDAVELSVDVDGVGYDASGGSVTLNVLAIDGETAQLAASLDAVVEASDGATADVGGDVDASVD